MTRPRALALILGAALAVVLAMLLREPAREFLKVDRCLDRGGRWNYEAGKCEWSPQGAGRQGS